MEIKEKKKKKNRVRIFTRLKIDGNPIDTKVDIFDKDGVPIPFGAKNSAMPDERVTFYPKQINLAVVEKSWDNFDLELYMEILRCKIQNL